MKLSELKSIIQEVVRTEVRTVLREELSNINRQPIQQSVVKPIKKTGNSLQDVLNETAMNSDWRSMGNFTAEHAPMFTGRQTMSTPQVGSLDGFMRANAAPGAQDLRQIEINTVPDFSGMMNTMKQKGML